MSMEQLDLQKPEDKNHLVDVQPHELKFTFEVKKQSSCAVRLTNVSDQCVAFKVKTTSPKKYCVRPNIGVIEPNSTFDFTVTMQAQKSAPSDMQCKDKFLIQSTVAPSGTTEEDITSEMFAKESRKYVEELKLRVLLIIPSNSPVMSPVNGVFKQEESCVTKTEEEKLLTGVENLPSHEMPAKNPEDEKLAMYAEKLTPTKAVENVQLPNDCVQRNSDKDVASRPLHDAEGSKLKLSREVEELKSLLSTLDSELMQAKANISKLTDEKNGAIQENQTLKQEMVVTRRKTGARRVERGFPPLFVCMVALISVTLGFLIHG